MRVVPQQLVIEVTNRCNLQCRYCPNVLNKGQIGGFPEGDMEFDFFKSLIDRIDFDTTVCAWMNGEPLMHPQYLDMLKHMTERKVNFYTTTNLTIWNQELFEFYMRESSAYQILVSMDGLPWTGNISKARPGTNEETLLRNIDRLLDIKIKSESKVDVGVKICERGQDWGEVEKYIKYWLDRDGIDYVVMGKALKDINEVTMRSEPCLYYDPKLMMIRWDGTLVLCSYNDAIVNGLALSYGKLDKTTPLLDAYNNEFITELRNRQNRGDHPWPCSTCGFAYTGNGYTGEITFRDDPNQTTIYHTVDYYNLFFSKVKKRKPREYYTDMRRI